MLINFCNTINEWCIIFKCCTGFKITTYNPDITPYDVPCTTISVRMTIDIVQTLFKNLESLDAFNKFNIFLIFHYSYYSVAINESKEMFKVVFLLFVLDNVGKSCSFTYL